MQALQQAAMTAWQKNVYGMQLLIDVELAKGGSTLTMSSTRLASIG